MRKIKYFFLVIIVLLFTGCSGKYNLTFNKDLSVEEELNIFIDNTNDEMYERTYKLFQEANIPEDKYNIIVVDDDVHITYKEKYSSFDDYYLNSNLYKALFEDIEFSKDNSGMKIKSESKFKLDDKDSNNTINSYDIDDFNININIPYKVNQNNADSIKDNIYTWSLNNKDTYKSINLDFSYRNDYNQNIIVIITIGIAMAIIIGYVIINLIKNKRI